jgi:hypothetical protein
MVMPAHLRRIIDRESERLIDEPGYDLSPEIRITLFDAIGPSTITNEDDYRRIIASKQTPRLTLADRIRAKAAILSAQRVASLWDYACKETDSHGESRATADHFSEHAKYLARRRLISIEEIHVQDVPRSYIPQHILEMAERAIVGAINDEERFLAEVNEWWEMYGRPEGHLREWAIKWSAQEALYLAVLCQTYAPREMPHDATDFGEYLDVLIDAPSGFSMLAYALEFVHGREAINVEKRREFWLWWLTCALSGAYDIEESRVQLEAKR